jgi:hypothetical protein
MRKLSRAIKRDLKRRCELDVFPRLLPGMLAWDPWVQIARATLANSER